MPGHSPQNVGSAQVGSLVLSQPRAQVASPGLHETAVSGRMQKLVFPGTEKPATALAVMFLSAPRMGTEKNMFTGTGGVITRTKRMFAGVAAASASLRPSPVSKS